MVNLTPFQNRRNRLGLTYAQLAERVGCSESTVHRWLTGQSQMSVGDVVVMAHALRIPFGDVVENLKAAIEGQAIAAEYRRACQDRTSTLQTAEHADARTFADNRQKTRA
ncbi:helix-turn-helix domain-containing protein [Streptomyces sp. NPDC001339]|uniref:helix-turn-helix domain-containing protein n=1 Tax=Streptomyces sp. NPDC001339 TaxID=3364563 RepID=UPI0036998B0B